MKEVKYIFAVVAIIVYFRFWPMVADNPLTYIPAFLLWALWMLFMSYADCLRKKLGHSIPLSALKGKGYLNVLKRMDFSSPNGTECVIIQHFLVQLGGEDEVWTKTPLLYGKDVTRFSVLPLFDDMGRAVKGSVRIRFFDSAGKSDEVSGDPD